MTPVSPPPGARISSFLVDSKPLREYEVQMSGWDDQVWRGRGQRGRGRGMIRWPVARGGGVLQPEVNHTSKQASGRDLHPHLSPPRKPLSSCNTIIPCALCRSAKQYLCCVRSGLRPTASSQGASLTTPGAIASPVDAALETELCKDIEARDEGLGRLDLLSSFKDRLTRK